MKQKLAIAAAACTVALGNVFAQTPAATPPTVPPPDRQKQEAGIAPRPTRPTEQLTEEQRRKLQEANEKIRQEQTAVYEKVRTVRANLDELARAENYNESAIREKALELGKLEGELAIIRARHYKELRTVLPKEHFDKMQAPGGGARPPALQQRLNSIVTNNASSTARPGLPPESRPAPPPQGK